MAEKPMAEITWNGAAATYSIKPHGKFERGKTRTTNDEELIAYCKNVRGFAVFVPEPRKPAPKSASEPEGDDETEDEKPEPTGKGKGKGGPRRGR